MSVAYGANTGQTTMGIVAMLHEIAKSQAVPATAKAGIVLHAIKTVAMLFGTINWGGRLVPVTGMPCMVVSIAFCTHLQQTCADKPKQTRNSLSQACHASCHGRLDSLLHTFATELY